MSKIKMKEICNIHGLPTTRHILIKTKDDEERVINHLSLPVIVKLAYGYGSVGLYKESRVANREGLAPVIERLKKEVESPEIYVEEFVDGREFTVMVIENPDSEADPIVLTPME
jgi:D-alanine-D-alanine ligase